MATAKAEDKSKGDAAKAPGTGDEPQSSQDLTIFVQNLLQQMQNRFQTMSNAIITRIDDMGNRIDELEKSIAELMTQAGAEEESDSKASKEDDGAK